MFIYFYLKIHRVLWKTQDIMILGFQRISNVLILKVNIRNLQCKDINQRDLGASTRESEDQHEAWEAREKLEVKPSSITGCQDRRHQEHKGVNTRIGILKTHQRQETSEANEGAEGELKRKLIPGVNIFWNQDCFKMAEQGSLWSPRQEILKKQPIIKGCLVQS